MGSPQRGSMGEMLCRIEHASPRHGRYQEIYEITWGRVAIVLGLAAWMVPVLGLALAGAAVGCAVIRLACCSRDNLDGQAVLGLYAGGGRLIMTSIHVWAMTLR